MAKYSVPKNGYTKHYNSDELFERGEGYAPTYHSRRERVAIGENIIGYPVLFAIIWFVGSCTADKINLKVNPVKQNEQIHNIDKKFQENITYIKQEMKYCKNSIYNCKQMQYALNEELKNFSSFKKLSIADKIEKFSYKIQ